MQKGIFITFEGPDGSGKTTISTKVYELFKSSGYPVIYTREPGGIEIAEQIRNIILDPDNKKMDAKTEALLYAASRRQHLVEKIIPALNNKQIVICDRFVDSSLAYQGYGREIGVKEVKEINDFAIESYQPDFTLFLNISASDGLKRLKNRTFKDRLDLETLDFHQRVFDGYQLVLANMKQPHQVIDANRDIDSVTKDCYEAILKVIYDYK
ncbi:MAG: dTMP kinase [Erysipelotrichaceae bacterium]